MGSVLSACEIGGFQMREIWTISPAAFVAAWAHTFQELPNRFVSGKHIVDTSFGTVNVDTTISGNLDSSFLYQRSNPRPLEVLVYLWSIFLVNRQNFIIPSPQTLQRRTSVF